MCDLSFEVLKCEHDSTTECLCRTSFVKAFKQKMVENLFSFCVIDTINNVGT